MFRPLLQSIQNRVLDNILSEFRTFQKGHHPRLVPYLYRVIKLPENIVPEDDWLLGLGVGMTVDVEDVAGLRGDN